LTASPHLAAESLDRVTDGRRPPRERCLIYITHDVPAASSCHWIYSASDKHDDRLLGKWVGVSEQRRAGEKAEGGEH